MHAEYFSRDFLSDLPPLQCPILCSDWSTLSLTSFPAVPAPEDLPLVFALVLVLLLAGADACAAAGGRSPLPAVFLAGGLHQDAAAAPHSGSSCGLRDPDGDPVAEVSLFFFFFFVCSIVMLPTYWLSWGAFQPALLCHLNSARLCMVWLSTDVFPQEPGTITAAVELCLQGGLKSSMSSIQRRLLFVVTIFWSF